MAKKPITLKYDATCTACGAKLPAESKALWYGKGRVYGLKCHQMELPAKPLAAVLEFLTGAGILPEPHAVKVAAAGKKPWACWFPVEDAAGDGEMVVAIRCAKRPTAYEREGLRLGGWRWHPATKTWRARGVELPPLPPAALTTPVLVAPSGFRYAPPPPPPAEVEPWDEPPSNVVRFPGQD